MNRLLRRMTARCAGLFSLPLAVAAWADCPLDPCRGDLNGDQSVTLADLSILLSDFGCAPPANCVGDVDGDNDTDLPDLSILLSTFGLRCGPFEYPPPSSDPVAEQIGLETLGPAGPLFASDDLIARVRIDLDAIVQAQPLLANQPHTPEWVPDHVLVGLVAGANRDDYDCLNRYYEAVVFGSIPSLNLEFLRFPRALNPEAMSAIYSQLAEVNYAEPDGLIGGENFWRPTPLPNGVWQWQVDDGFTDCFDGCDCHRVYDFDTDGLGGAAQTGYNEFGMPWCEF